MTIRHHPTNELLTAHAAGLLTSAHRAAVATHIFGCEKCRAWAQALEQVGGVVLEDLPPSPLADDALHRTMALIGRSAADAPRSTESWSSLDLPNLPPMLRRQTVGPWRRVAPGLRLRPLAAPDKLGTRVFLLEGRPGTKLLTHTHRGTEMSCVLSGGFSHEGGHFGAGDFDLGDDQCTHSVTVDPGADCIALIVLEGSLRLTGWGRALQPFLRL